MEGCIFCQIIAGKKPGRIVYQDEHATAFFDAHPLAPVHILIVPNRHIDSVNEVASQDEPALGHLFSVAAVVARQAGVAVNGYRLIVNTGLDAGQIIRHLHVHLLGGRRLPPKLG